MFVNPSAGDLHLVSNSATQTNVIDQVAPMADVADDWDGSARPIGSKADIGADEYQTSPPPPPVPASVPAAPNNLTATGGNNQVALSWTGSSGATSYNIYRSTSSGGEGSTPYKTGVTGTSLTDTGVTNGTTYYYQVSAVNAVGESGKSTEASAADGPAGTTTPTVTAETPAASATAVAVGTSVKATFNESVPQVSSNNFTLTGPSGVVAATVTYATNTATLQPSAPLANSTTYTATVSGVKDAAGNVMAAPVSWSFTTAVSSNSDPLNKPVLNQLNFTYLGSFLMPTSANGWSTAYSNGGLTYRYVNGQLHFLTTSHANSGGLVYETNYPGIGTSGTLPQAKVVQNWGDVYTGQKWVGNNGGTSALSGEVGTYGLYYDQNLGRLYWSYGDWYNASNPYNPSFGYSVLNDSTGVATGVGAWSLANRPEKFDRGGTLRIPQWFADRFTGGKSLGVGFGGSFSIISSASFGPALAAVSDPNPTTNPDDSSLANVPLIGYPSGAPDRAHRDPNYTSFYDGGTYPTTPGQWNPSNGTGYWTWSDLIYGGSAWIDTPQLGGVLYIAKVGQGNVWYQTSDIHSQSGAFEWMVYDPKDLAAVASGAKQQWQIQPKYEWTDSTLPIPASDQGGWSGNGWSQVGGVTFDPTTNRLYVLVNGAWQSGTEYYPEVYVYQVGTPLS
jgi:fibronectin type 3 domain-containing protein